MSIFDDLQHALGDAYRLDRELGGGGMSRVFLADDLALSRKVVLKVLPSELAAVVNVERFNRETLWLARLQHPHIVPVLNVGSLHGLPWFSMPYIEGESLRARIVRVREVPIADVVSVMRDVAKALAYAHERGVIHRDIKPDNILLTGDSATVADFGIAKAVNAARTDASAEPLTQMGMAIGTPAYMSPEQVAGGDAVDHRWDIYALGCVAYEMLCGRAPFADRPFQSQLVAHLTENAEPIGARRADMPAALAALVMQCLEKDPASRPQDARDVVLALEQADVRSGEVPRWCGASPSRGWPIRRWRSTICIVARPWGRDRASGPISWFQLLLCWRWPASTMHGATRRTRWTRIATTRRVSSVRTRSCNPACVTRSHGCRRCRQLRRCGGKDFLPDVSVLAERTHSVRCVLDDSFCSMSCSQLACRDARANRPRRFAFESPNPIAT